jgi:hypothetical protein
VSAECANLVRDAVLWAPCAVRDLPDAVHATERVTDGVTPRVGADSPPSWAGATEMIGPTGFSPRRPGEFSFFSSLFPSLQYSIQIQIYYFEVQIPSIKYDPIYEYKRHYFRY